MKVKVSVIDDNGKEFIGEVNLVPIQTTKLTSHQEQNPELTSYKGLKGGIDFLIERGHLNQLRTAKEISQELKKETYTHSIQSVDKRLRFLVSKKILARIKEDGVWKYGVRR